MKASGCIPNWLLNSARSPTGKLRRINYIGNHCGSVSRKMERGNHVPLRSFREGNHPVSVTRKPAHDQHAMGLQTFEGLLLMKKAADAGEAGRRNRIGVAVVGLGMHQMNALTPQPASEPNSSSRIPALGRHGGGEPRDPPHAAPCRALRGLSGKEKPDGKAVEGNGKQPQRNPRLRQRAC